MRKIVLVVMMLVFVLALSGCEDGYLSDNHKDCVENGGTYSIPELVCYENIESYSQEEVDLIISELESKLDNQVQEILDLLYASYVEYDEFDNMLYSGCEIIEGIKHCNIIFDLNKNYVEESYLWANFYDSFSEDLIEYIDESLEIEDDTIETTIAYTTLSMIDILLFMYNEELESGTIFTEEEIVYYDMLIIMRELYINELENGDE